MPPEIALVNTNNGLSTRVFFLSAPLETMLRAFSKWRTSPDLGHVPLYAQSQRNISLIETGRKIFELCLLLRKFHSKVMKC